jgi:hypothetical protein
MLDGIGLLAKVLGFIALYSIAIALTDRDWETVPFL